MINDRLGGGGGYNNIVPITSEMNGLHRKMENAAQNILGNGGGLDEVSYSMNILRRRNYIWPDGNKVNNLADKFQQSYGCRKKAVPEGGSSTRPRLAQDAGKEEWVVGQVLDMDLCR